MREAVAEQIVTALEDQEPTARIALAARPVVEALVADLVATEGFQGVFHAGVRELHAAIVNGRSSRFVVHVDDTAQLVRDGLSVVNPDLAAAIPEGALPVAVGISQSTPLDTTMRVASLAGWLAAPFALGALACFAMAVRRARDRRHALEAVGLALILTGVAHFALLSVGVNLAASLGDEMRQRTALRAVFWSATHLINVQAKVVIMIGAVLAVAAAQAGTGNVRTRLVALGEQARAALARPSWRAVACLVAVAAGYFAMRWPEATTAIVIRIARVHRVPRRRDRAARRDGVGALGAGRAGTAPSVRSPAGVGGDGSDRVRQHRDAVRRPGLRPRPAGAERGPRRHGRGRLQRPCRAVRPATRRGRPRGLAQLHGRQLAGRVPLRPAPGWHRRPARQRCARVPHRPPLRRADPGPRTHRLPQRVRGGARQRPR